MAKTGRGKVINLSGGGAASPRANFTAYATAKAGLVRFSETLSEETRDAGVDVNCIAPGAMDTEMLSEVVKAGAAAAGQKEYDLALKVSKTAGNSLERAAALCVFLASEASDGITGKLISAIWDPWETLAEHLGELQKTDIYTLRRIVPKDRGMNWGGR
jgi:3-oxoacyl-[acyl-carrier protein] reductase